MSPKFEETTDALKGEVYTLGYTQIETCNKVTTSIALYVGTISKNGGYIKRTLDKLTVINILLP